MMALPFSGGSAIGLSATDAWRRAAVGDGRQRNTANGVPGNHKQPVGHAHKSSRRRKRNDASRFAAVDRISWNSSARQGVLSIRHWAVRRKEKLLCQY